jgi:acetyl esterase
MAGVLLGALTVRAEDHPAGQIGNLINKNPPPVQPEELDPALARVLQEQKNKKPLDLLDTPFEPVRKRIHQSLVRWQSKAVPIARIRDVTIDGPNGKIPIRIYIPSLDSLLGVVIYLHGGGWVAAAPEHFDTFCSALAQDTPCIVVSVGYRLAPENPFPAGLEDAFAACKWVDRRAGSFGGDPLKLALAGDSTGGNLVAACTLLARGEKQPQFDSQVLFYPLTDASRFNRPSARKFADGYGLTLTQLKALRQLYLPDPSQGDSPLVSPLRAPSKANLPPALVITAGFDPLRDQGEDYANALARAGVQTQLFRYRAMSHGFLLNSKLVPEDSYRALTQAASWISQHWQGERPEAPAYKPRKNGT